MHFWIINRVRLATVVCLIAVALLCLPMARKSQMTVGEEGVLLPIVMYHHVLKDAKALGKFVISPQELEADLQYLNENGYQSVSVEQVTAFVQNGAALPEKPIMLTFDDGYLSFAEYVLPLLEKYNQCAVLSVIGAYSDTYSQKEDRNVAYAHVTWEDVKALADSGRVDIENHTYNLHTIDARKGSMKKKGENTEAYQAMLQKDLRKNQELIIQATGKAPICYTYPYGFMSQEAQPVLEELGFVMSLSCNEGASRITRDETCLFGLRRCNRPHGKGITEVLKQAK